MKTKIERVNYYELWNNEFPVVALRTIGIAGKYDMAGLHLGKSYNELAAFRQPLENMKVYVRKNEKIEAAHILDCERDTLIDCMRKAAKAFENVNIPQVKTNYEALEALLDKHQAHTIANTSLTSETERLNVLKKDLLENTAAQKAIKAFGLELVAIRLFEANSEYEAMFREYVADKSVEEHIDVVALRRSCSKTLTQFYDAVEYCAFEHDNINYKPLANELNVLNNYYRTQIKIRITRRKNNKKDKGDPIPPPAE